MNEIKDILWFQIERRLKSLAKNALILLEKFKEHNEKLETLLKNMGFEEGEDKEFFKSKDNFTIGRKEILDNLGDIERELFDLFKKFDIKLK